MAVLNTRIPGLAISEIRYYCAFVLYATKYSKKKVQPWRDELCAGEICEGVVISGNPIVPGKMPEREQILVFLPSSSCHGHSNINPNAQNHIYS